MIKALPLSLLVALTIPAFASPERVAVDVTAVSERAPAAPAAAVMPGQAIPNISGAPLDVVAPVAPLVAAPEAAASVPAAAAGQAAFSGQALSISSSRSSAAGTSTSRISADLQLDAAAVGVEAADQVFLNGGRRTALDARAPVATIASGKGLRAAASRLLPAASAPRARTATIAVAGVMLSVALPAAAGASTLSTLAHSAGVLSTLSPLAAGLLLLWTLGVSSLHAYEETKGHLWSYFGKVYKNPLLNRLGGVLGFVGVVAPALLLQGSAAVLAFVGGSPAALAVLIGARVGDAYFSHLIPARLGHVPNPGLPTAMIYVVDAIFLYLAFADSMFAAPYARLGLAFGVGFFAALPIVFAVSGWALRRLGFTTTPAAPPVVPANVMKQYREKKSTVDFIASYNKMPNNGMLGGGPYIPVPGDLELATKQAHDMLEASETMRTLEAAYPGIERRDALVRAYARQRAFRPANIRRRLEKAVGL